MTPLRLELLTRRGCHLCAGAVPVVRRVAALAGAAVVVTDIDADPELAVDFGLRIPVVRTAGGEVLAEGEVRFRPLLAAALRARLGRCGPGGHAAPTSRRG